MKAKIVFVSEYWGEHEEKLRKGLVGTSGVEFFKMMDSAGLISLTAEAESFIRKYWEDRDPKFVDALWSMYPELYRTNVFNLRPRSGKPDDFCGGKGDALPGYPNLLPSKYVREEFEPELDRLGDEILAQDPNLVVTMGNCGLWAMMGMTAITKNRGYTVMSTHTVSGFKVLPTYNPAATIHQYDLRPVLIADLNKAARECEWPEIRRPSREIWIEPTLDDIRAFTERYIRDAPILSVDIETSGNQVTCIGFAPGPSVAIVIPFYDRRKAGRCYWPDQASETGAWGLIRDILGSPRPPKLFQNGLYDIAFLWRAYGIRVMGAEHDSMLLHHALQPESLKGLGFLGSIYTDESAWKKLNVRGKTTIKRDD